MFISIIMISGFLWNSTYDNQLLTANCLLLPACPFLRTRESFRKASLWHQYRQRKGGWGEIRKNEEKNIEWDTLLSINTHKNLTRQTSLLSFLSPLLCFILFCFLNIKCHCIHYSKFLKISKTSPVHLSHIWFVPRTG